MSVDPAASLAPSTAADAQTDASLKVGAQGRSFVAELFGHRVYPEVAKTAAASADQEAGICPFLTAAHTVDTPCVKAPRSRGVCTVSSVVDRVRYDWLVCPHRALDPTFMGASARRIFGYSASVKLHFIAAPTLEMDATQSVVRDALADGDKVIIYFQEKLGGELGISKTDASPEFSFDWTLVEVLAVDPLFEAGRFGILELQTMDFHGSYAHAVELLTARMATPAGFHEWLETESGQSALGRKMEGPNLSNVFKRTFYQMAYKFALGGHGNCAGAGFAIPQSVWESWLRHLGNPSITQLDDGTYSLGVPAAESNAWIFVFELDKSGGASPSPLRSWKQIRIDVPTLTAAALEGSPAVALAAGGPVDALSGKISARVRRLWPGIVPAPPRARPVRGRSAPKLEDIGTSRGDRG